MFSNQETVRKCRELAASEMSDGLNGRSDKTAMLINELATLGISLEVARRVGMASIVNPYVAEKKAAQ